MNRFRPPLLIREVPPEVRQPKNRKRIPLAWVPLFVAVSPIIAEALMPVAASPFSRSCPEGHTNLKTIPVLEGYRTYDATEAAKVSRGEAVYGGCGSEDRQVTVCKTCEYRYSQSSTTWTKQASDPESFRPAIPTLLIDVTASRERARIFWRTITRKGIWIQRVKFNVKGGIQEANLSSRLAKRLAALGVTDLHRYAKRQAKRYILFSGEWNKLGVSVYVREESDGKSVTVEATDRHAWVDTAAGERNQNRNFGRSRDKTTGTEGDLKDVK